MEVGDTDDAKFYNNDDDGNAADATAFDTLSTLLAKRRAAPAAAAPSSRNAVREIRQSDSQRKDDVWIAKQMGAAGFRDAAAQLNIDSSTRYDKPKVELTVNRGLLPPFIVGNGGEPVLFSSQQGLVIPLKDPKSDFAASATKGSAVLREHRRRKMDRQAVRDALGDADRLVKSDTGVSKEEYDALQRRLRAERLRNATPEEAAAMLQRERDDEARRARADASLASTSTTVTHQTTFTQQHSIAEQRRLLPIYACRAELLRYVRENSVVVVAGETGSGKTTQLVQYLYEEGYATWSKIACTQPRRMAAVSVAERVATEVGTPIGELVGFSIRLEDKTSSKTKIKFMTDGILLKELVNDRRLMNYSVVVLDEAHERTTNTDILLGAMKQVIRERSDFRLVVTSATMELHRFSTFFDNAPIFTIPGRTFPIDLRYEESPVEDYVDLAVFRAVEIHTTTPIDGDILIFMAGEDDVQGVAELIRAKLTEMGGEWMDSLVVLPCYSLLPSVQQRAIRDPPPPGKRKCIVATNIAETSLTIDGIRYVIDSGFMKCKVFKPNIGMNALSLYPVSRAQADQRKGRAGRTAAGVCYRLYTEYQYERELLPVPVPEMQRSSIDSVVLLLKSIDVKNIADFDFIDPPPHENVRSSLYQLWLIRALDDAGHITPDGRKLADFPTEPPLGRVILQSDVLKCSDEVLTIAAMMSVDSKSVFTLPKGREDEALAAREKFFVAESDHLTLLNVFDQFAASGFSKSFADAHFMNYLALKRAVDVRLQFVERITKTLKIKTASCEGDTDTVRRCFTFGFFPNAARRTGLMEYTTMLTGVPCQVHPSSALTANRLLADYVIYNDFILTGKEYMSVVSSVEPGWLVEASGGLFSARGDTLMSHISIIEQEKRKAMATLAQQPIRAQPAAVAPHAATSTAAAAGTVDLKTVDATPPVPRFVPRARR